MARPQEARKRRRLVPPPPPAPTRRLPVRQRSFWAGIAVGLGVSAALLTLTFVHRGPSSPPANAPWGVSTTDLRARLARIGLPALPVEGKALHTHEHLDLYVNGMHVAVPAGVGIGSDPRFFSPLHTHDRTGIVHVESPVNKTYRLGQFFDVWGVRLSRTCIGDFCSEGGRTLQAFVGGRRVTGDPARIPLRPHDEIVIVFGTRSQRPRRIPASYSFPSGY
jgi:hypothetical protein